MLSWFFELIWRKLENIILERMKKNDEEISDEERIKLAKQTIARMGIDNKVV